MQIVIEIPEEMKDTCDNDAFEQATDYVSWFNGTLVMAIKNGIPLPKGHGDLIDRSKLETTDVSPEPWYSPMWAYSEWMIDDAEVVIPADKEDAND